MDQKHPNQTDGSGANARSEGESGDLASANPEAHDEFQGRSAGGDSAGGAYPNPHSGKEDGGEDGFMGHGGQSEMKYYGKGQLGEKKLESNPNSPD